MGGYWDCVRWKLFKGHYKLLREKRRKESLVQTLLSTYPLGVYHPSYSMWNCAIWAWSNSKTHNVDGSYL